MKLVGVNGRTLVPAVKHAEEESKDKHAHALGEVVLEENTTRKKNATLTCVHGENGVSGASVIKLAMVSAADREPVLTGIVWTMKKRTRNKKSVMFNLVIQSMSQID